MEEFEVLSHIETMLRNNNHVGMVEAIETANTRRELQNIWFTLRRCGNDGTRYLERVQRRLKGD